MLTPAPCHFIVINTLLQLVNTNPVASDTDTVINLSHLGSKLYGNPDYDFGRQRTINIDENLEENGPYLEGDLLVPLNLAKNGMKSESLRWKNGEIPYVIRGKFSECFTTNFSFRNISHFIELK